ncbi:hypothetical protein [Phytobacter palmae]|uniref:hypothetical protein n=1 Tax=Phytobacter palmae TaxID=1855371 RepID=UPI003CCD6525
MFYFVKCSYTGPQSEGGWNEFYRQEKVPALVSVSGFRSSQRFRALHTVKDANVSDCEAYRHNGGGIFSRRQAWGLMARIRSFAPGRTTRIVG